MTDLNRDTGGTSQRRGVHGDPWRQAHPVPPTGPQDYAKLERYVAPPESVVPPQPRPYLRPGDRLGDGRPRFPLLTWTLLVAIVAIAAVAFLIANRSAAPRSAPDPSGPVATVPGPSGAPDSHVVSRVAGITPPGAPNTLDPRVGREGVITHMGRGGWPIEYLAIPLGPGHRVTICGPADCRIMVSTDAGPNRERIRAGVIADVSWQRFETLCGVPARMGRCPGSWTIVTGSPTLPPTDVAP